MDQTEFVTMFESFDVAIVRSAEKYENTWYDRESSSGALETYHFSPQVASGDLYVSVHTYPLNTIPLTGDCFTDNL
jgi:hypothetical protein